MIVEKSLLWPFVLITSLFALWGFANAVTDPMVTAFKKVLELSNFQASLVQLAFYGGYFTMALPAALFVWRYSYKTGVLIGLSLYALGAFLFYPAAMAESFGFFLTGLYVLTFGLAFLETTANPYILAMGDKRTSIQRLNLAQAFNPLGLLGGLLVAQQFVLMRLQSDDIDYGQLDESAKAMIRQADLLVIRDPYLALGVVVLIILLVIAFNKMPEGKSSGVSESIRGTITRLFSKRKYVFGVVAQALNVGAQIMCWTYIYHYAESINVSGEVAANYQFFAFVLFFVGRFICTFLLRYVDSGRLLMVLSLSAALSVLGTMFLIGMPGLYSLVSTSLFMSLMFPTIYGISLEGLSEDESKIGAAGLVMAIVGGALMPSIQGSILDLGGAGLSDVIVLGIPEINFSFILPLICFLMIAFFGSYATKLKKLVRKER